MSVWSLDWEDPLAKGMATHSSILAWEIPWTAWQATVYGITNESDMTEQLNNNKYYKSAPFHINQSTKWRNTGCHLEDGMGALASCEQTLRKEWLWRAGMGRHPQGWNLGCIRSATTTIFKHMIFSFSALLRVSFISSSLWPHGL